MAHSGNLALVTIHVSTVEIQPIWDVAYVDPSKALRLALLHVQKMSLELKKMLPRDKHDVQSAEALVLMGYPAVEPIIPQLLQWCQDGNWPVARVIAPFLADIGPPLAPHVRMILNGADDTWKYFLLQTVIAESIEMKRLLHPELERLARRPTASEAAEELDSIASALLAIP